MENACLSLCRRMQQLQSRHQHQRFHHAFLIQEPLTGSADSACSQPCPDNMRHLPENTGEWCAVALAGPTADAVEGAHTSSLKKTKRLFVQSRHDMVVGFFCVSWHVGRGVFQYELGHVACRFDDAPWNVHTKAHISVHLNCVVVFDVPLRVAVSLCFA